MIGLSIRYFKKNKKQSLTIILAVILASILLFSVGILFSSFRQYLIDETLKDNDYHVKILGDVSYDENMISLRENDGYFYIKFKDLTKSYENTEKLCHYNECDEVIYNVKLLSLYGVGDSNYLDLFKGLIVIIIFILSISVFFIIYNSFMIAILKKRKDIFLLLCAGASKSQIFFALFFEELICGFIGIIIGFGLSVLFNILIINVINGLLFEFLNGQFYLYIYIPFVLICLIFIILIVILSSLIPLFKVRKWKIMEFLRKDEINKNVKFKKDKNFILGFALTNYKRSEIKYRAVIICIFILMILFNVSFSFMSYTLKIFQSYMKLPNYDVALMSHALDYERLEDFSSYLKADEKVIFKTCEQEVMIDKKNHNEDIGEKSNLFITNLGGNELINKVDSVILKGDKMYNIKYEPFKNLDYLVINNFKINVKLSDNSSYFFENMLSEGNYILNLSDRDFNLVCPKYEGRAFIKTREKGLDKKISEYALKNDFYDFKFVNVKKGYEFINNVILIMKIFMGISCLIIILVVIVCIFNITYANIKIRKKEFATLKSLGFTHINCCLALEGLIICIKGAFYAFPFILLVSRYLYSNFSIFFDLKFMIMNYPIFLICFLISFVLVFGCMFLSHICLYKDSLINNIKDDIF